MRRQSCQTRKHVLPGRLPLLPSPLRRTLRNVSASHHCKPEASPRRHPRRNSELKTGLPEVSCRSWCVFDRRRGRELMGAGQNKQREIASLSKVVNYLTCRRLAARLGVFVQQPKLEVPLRIFVKVTYQQGDWVQVQNLFYAMLLPSGNDAALLLAQGFGAFLQLEGSGRVDSIAGIHSLDLQQHNSSLKQYVGLFVRQMNSTAGQLGLQLTFFSNPHGSTLRENYSNASEVAVLSHQAMQDEQFRTIVGTPVFRATIKYASSCSGIISSKTITWQNTNELLFQKDNCCGLKTGYTATAGGCLSASFIYAGQEYIVVTLASQSLEDRFKDSCKIADFLEQFVLQ